MSRLLLPLLALLLLVGCDAVERPDRWREDPAPIVPRRNVLLVDFTGQRCSNCPAAADLLHSLTAGPAGARIIAVSVHGGALALSTDASPLGLAGPDARRLTDEARVSSWPQGTVDRPVGGTLLRPSAWNAALAERLALAADADAAAQQSLVADAHVALATRTLSYTLRPRHLTDAAGQPDAETYLHLWLVEDSITAPQTLADGTERADYLHRHVLRLDLTGPAAHRLAAPRPGSSAPAMTRPAASPQTDALTRTAGTPPRSTDAQLAAASHFAPPPCLRRQQRGSATHLARKPRHRGRCRSLPRARRNKAPRRSRFVGTFRHHHALQSPPPHARGLPHPRCPRPRGRRRRHPRRSALIPALRRHAPPHFPRPTRASETSPRARRHARPLVGIHPLHL